MKHFIKDTGGWIAGLFKDETGTPSSKRFVGIILALSLAVTMYHNSFSDVSVAPAPYLVDVVALLAFGCLGLSSIDKFTSAKKDVKKATSQDKSEEIS
jgi:hypothetical protein